MDLEPDYLDLDQLDFTIDNKEPYCKDSVEEYNFEHYLLESPGKYYRDVPIEENPEAMLDILTCGQTPDLPSALSSGVSSQHTASEGSVVSESDAENIQLNAVTDAFREAREDNVNKRTSFTTRDPDRFILARFNQPRTNSAKERRGSDQGFESEHLKGNFACNSRTLKFNRLDQRSTNSLRSKKSSSDIESHINVSLINRRGSLPNDTYLRSLTTSTEYKNSSSPKTNLQVKERPKNKSTIAKLKSLFPERKHSPSSAKYEVNNLNGSLTSLSQNNNTQPHSHSNINGSEANLAFPFNPDCSHCASTMYSLNISTDGTFNTYCNGVSSLRTNQSIAKGKMPRHSDVVTKFSLPSSQKIDDDVSSTLSGNNSEVSGVSESWTFDSNSTSDLDFTDITPISTPRTPPSVRRNSIGNPLNCARRFSQSSSCDHEIKNHYVFLTDIQPKQEVQDNGHETSQTSDSDKINGNDPQTQFISIDNIEPETENGNNFQKSGDELFHLASHGPLHDLEKALDRMNDDKALALRDSQGNSLAHLAAENGNLECTKYLLDRFKNLQTTRNFSGKVPVMLAVEYGHVQLLKYFIDLAVETSTEFPIRQLYQTSAKFGQSNCLRVLLQKYQDNSLTDEEGNSPVHVAAKHGCLESLQVLFEHQFDMFCMNKNGDTPFQLAQKNGKTSCVQYLKLIQTSHELAEDCISMAYHCNSLEKAKMETEARLAKITEERKTLATTLQDLSHRNGQWRAAGEDVCRLVSRLSNQLEELHIDNVKLRESINGGKKSIYVEEQVEESVEQIAILKEQIEELCELDIVEIPLISDDIKPVSVGHDEPNGNKYTVLDPNQLVREKMTACNQKASYPMNSSMETTSSNNHGIGDQTQTTFSKNNLPFLSTDRTLSPGIEKTFSKSPLCRQSPPTCSKTNIEIIDCVTPSKEDTSNMLKGSIPTRTMNGQNEYNSCTTETKYAYEFKQNIHKSKSSLADQYGQNIECGSRSDTPMLPSLPTSPLTLQEECAYRGDTPMLPECDFGSDSEMNSSCEMTLHNSLDRALKSERSDHLLMENTEHNHGSEIFNRNRNENIKRNKSTNSVEHTENQSNGTILVNQEQAKPKVENATSECSDIVRANSAAVYKTIYIDKTCLSNTNSDASTISCSRSPSPKHHINTCHEKTDSVPNLVCKSNQFEEGQYLSVGINGDYDEFRERASSYGAICPKKIQQGWFCLENGLRFKPPLPQSTTSVCSSNDSLASSKRSVLSVDMYENTMKAFDKALSSSVESMGLNEPQGHKGLMDFHPKRLLGKFPYGPSPLASTPPAVDSTLQNKSEENPQKTKAPNECQSTHTELLESVSDSKSEYEPNCINLRVDDDLGSLNIRVQNSQIIKPVYDQYENDSPQISLDNVESLSVNTDNISISSYDGSLPNTTLEEFGVHFSKPDEPNTGNDYGSDENNGGRDNTYKRETLIENPVSSSYDYSNASSSLSSIPEADEACTKEHMISRLKANSPKAILHTIHELEVLPSIHNRTEEWLTNETGRQSMHSSSERIDLGTGVSSMEDDVFEENEMYIGFADEYAEPKTRSTNSVQPKDVSDKTSTTSEPKDKKCNEDVLMPLPRININPSNGTDSDNDTEISVRKPIGSLEDLSILTPRTRTSLALSISNKSEASIIQKLDTNKRGSMHKKSKFLSPCSQQEKDESEQYPYTVKNPSLSSFQRKKSKFSKSKKNGSLKVKELSPIDFKEIYERPVSNTNNSGEDNNSKANGLTREEDEHSDINGWVHSDVAGIPVRYRKSDTPDNKSDSSSHIPTLDSLTSGYRTTLDRSTDLEDSCFCESDLVDSSVGCDITNIRTVQKMVLHGKDRRGRPDGMSPPEAGTELRIPKSRPWYELSSEDEDVSQWQKTACWDNSSEEDVII